jgi:ESS family glutamate:Na+ symporter
MPTAYSPWFLLLLAVPLLLLGQAVIRRLPALARLNIPVPVVGGLLFSVAATAVGASFGAKVDAMWWTWLVTPEPEWINGPARNLNLPLLVAFFTCVGLGAPLRMLMGGGRMLLVLLVGTTLLAILQNAAGVAVATALGAPALLGVACGSLTLVGGHGTALGFAPKFEQAGLASAAAIGASAATFGLVAGALISGPIGAWLLRARRSASTVSSDERPVVVADFIGDVRGLLAFGRQALGHGLLVAACVKAGAWVSFELDRAGLAMPAYMGALLVGFGLRALHDAAGWQWLRGEVIGRFAAVLLPLFLVVTLAALNLRDLASVAGPMLAILTVNIVLTVAFVLLFAWPLLGRDYEAGVASAGFAGFAIGSTATAVAAMDAITREKGPAPRATTIVPPTGGFLIDLTNAPVISAFLR